MIPFLIESGDCSITHVLAESDYLLLLLPSTTETRGILDGAALAFLKPGDRGRSLGGKPPTLPEGGQPLLQMVDRARGY
jgi:hypothetical protein